ncbi:hypothetical protein N9Y42_03800 [Mariniblastus sp.]|nr:hypothetical protein [Mariniblastus sp.]
MTQITYSNEAYDAKRRQRSVEAAPVLSSPKETSTFPITDEPWSEALPPTADIYPSVDLCGRPLAFQIAEEIRRDRKSAKKFAVTFVKEQRPGDHDQWKPPRGFVRNFRLEFVKQFSGSTVVAPIKAAEMAAEANSTDDDLPALEIKLSYRPSRYKDNRQIAGEISARWTTRQKTRALALVSFVDKPWVTNSKDFFAKSKNDLAVGFSSRLARRPIEAFDLALRNAKASPNQVIDRFVQKLTLPYGELWQESILIDQGIPKNAMAGDHKNLVPMVRNWNSTDPQLNNPRYENHYLGLSTSNREGVASAAMPYSRDEAHEPHFPRRGGMLRSLILTATGLIAIGLISNLLTQGYYRQNIKYTVVTGVAVVFGLLILLLLLI